MIRTLTRCALLSALVASVCAANTASAASVSLIKAADRASLIESRHSAGEGAPVVPVTTRYFANDEVLISWDDQQVLMLCKEAVYLKIPAGKAGAGALAPETRQMIAYQALMSGMGSLAAVAEAAGDSVEVADDGSETRRVAESSWAYGVERYDVTTQRMADGALRVRTAKTATVNNAKPASPDDMFSTEDDQAARLSELAPVGSWTEVVIHGGPRQAQVDPAMSLKGWIPMEDDQATTVAEARRLHECK
ncbi:TPA: hypothetical protein ACKP8M_000068 [Stenotrophomonas maltophilia]|uniref:hypothetical protein n=1 Tax=Stenotrophomonas maltophilia TaxID=40324 RepID=UPI0021C6BBBC|nr:hypothetical protein [Stenotrophomonas maltophilia]MBN5078081.1 hypothetical protein [Stenotrophomonas maltophilia]MCU1085012.1 hypothetical protein [Stenotrophomonas maltophilia]MCU1161421.1 hypothetical protein [Stenotrophomonas maltophilia]HEL5571772.1 hypothetical protein [Stenotrophomonas maltophilia]